MRGAVGLFTGPLSSYCSFDLAGLCAAGLVEHGEQDRPTSRRQPIGHPGLVAEQVEPQLPNFSTEVAGVRLTECLGLLGEQADEEVDSTKITVSKTI